MDFMLPMGYEGNREATQVKGVVLMVKGSDDDGEDYDLIEN